MIIFIIIVTIVLMLVVSWLSLIADKNRTDIKGPMPYPIIGNGHLLAVDSTEFSKTLKKFEEKFNHSFFIHLFAMRYIVTSDPMFIEEVVSSTEHITKGTSYRFLQPWLGDGLLTSTGAKWKAHRKFLTPAFHFNILQNFLPVFSKNGKILIKNLHTLSDGASVDIFKRIALTALDNVTESIMGVSIDAQINADSAYVKAVDDISAIMANRMRNILVSPTVIFNLLPQKRIQDKALKVLHGQTMKVVNARRQELEKGNITGLSPNAEQGLRNKHAFLDLLLLAEVDGKKISDENIREEVDTFMFEGHDTTTSGITYSLYCISNHKEIQERVFKEQESIFGKHLKRDPTYTEVQKMKYLEMVIKESLRLYPSVPIIERTIKEDRVIAGLRVPKDTSVVLDFFNMQRRPDLFEDPLEFRPERFESVSRNPFYWLPFSAGPRNCIGQKFAMLEMKVVISEIIRNFRLLPSGEEPQLAIDLILRSQNGVKLCFEARN